ncbi:MAG TPA: glycosyl hydrolase [Chloroflexaceae bacterium]|nr:glycosyl hydrolase [Chloroflexaceae bacterium]
MKSALALLTALVTTLLAGLAAPPPATTAAPPAQARISPDAIGVVVRDPWYEFGVNPTYPAQPNYAAQERMGELLAEAGARWVRLEFIVQDGAGSFEAQIARNDYFIDVVAPRHGLKVLGLLAFRLVDIDPRNGEAGLISRSYLTSSPYGGGVNQYMQDWLDRALWIMNRYEGRVAAYEVFNEPNRLPVIGGFRGGEGIAPETVATLHTKLYRCFKQNQCDRTVDDPAWRPGVQLLVGGLHPRGSDKILGTLPEGGTLSDRDYLARLFTSPAFGGYRDSYGAFPVDGIGYHPYPAEIVTTLAAVDDEVARISRRLDEVRARLRAALQSTDPAAAELPFWITEIGYNAGYPGQSAAGQTLFLRAVFTTLATRGDVARVFWFKYEDFPPAGGPDTQRWGLVRIPFTEGDRRCPGGACYATSGEPELRRPAFWALRELAGLPVYRQVLPVVVR